MCATMNTGKQAREDMLHWEVEEMFAEAQESVEDNVPLNPDAEHLDGLSPDYAMTAWALYRREKAAKADRERKRISRKAKKCTPKMVERKCQQCGKTFLVVLNRRGTPRQYCKDACKVKAYRIRAHENQNAPVATDAEYSLCVTD